MGIRKLVWIVCDCCKESDASWFNAESVKEARTEAKNAGFKFKTGKWICNYCIDSIEEDLIENE